MILKRSIAALAAFLFVSVSTAARAADEAALAHARKLLRSAILVDGHNDLPWAVRTNKAAPGDVAAYDLRTTTSGQTDLARLKLGGVGAQFWSVYIPGETGSGFARTQLEQIDIARRIIAHYPDHLRFATTVADIRAAHRAGRIASLLGMEGGHAIEDSLGALRAYYDLGVRYMTLTHNVHTSWADSAGAAAGARRPHAVRRADRAGDEQARHAGRSVAHLRRHDGRRAARVAGAGDLLAFIGARALRRAPQRA